MPNPLIVDLRLQIDYGKPVPLTDFTNRIKELSVPGVYFIMEGDFSTEGEFSIKNFNPTDTRIHYIGKAIKETIHSRCRKHLWTITDAKNSNGNPKTEPGTRFKEYRSARNLDPKGLFVIPGFMDQAYPYLISCAEEYLLFCYLKKNKDIPIANTKK